MRRRRGEEDEDEMKEGMIGGLGVRERIAWGQWHPRCRILAVVWNSGHQYNTLPHSVHSCLHSRQPLQTVTQHAPPSRLSTRPTGVCPTCAGLVLAHRLHTPPVLSSTCTGPTPPNRPKPAHLDRRAITNQRRVDLWSACAQEGGRGSRSLGSGVANRSLPHIPLPTPPPPILPPARRARPTPPELRLVRPPPRPTCPYQTQARVSTLSLHTWLCPFLPTHRCGHPGCRCARPPAWRSWPGRRHRWGP